MYRGKLWTMRQYAGFSTSENTNSRFKFLLDQGQTGLSLALDLPTQLGLDSDDPLAKDDVGKLGVAIDTLRDMEEMFEGIPLDKISTSFTINSTASIVLAMYVATAEKQGVDPSTLRGTIQNDIIKEYIARGTYIFPPEPSIRLIGDTIEYCMKHIPRFNSVSVSGTHICECGATPAQGVAYPFLTGIAYLQEVLDRGYDIDDIAPLLSFHLIAGGVQYPEGAVSQQERESDATEVFHRGDGRRHDGAAAAEQHCAYCLLCPRGIPCRVPIHEPSLFRRGLCHPHGRGNSDFAPDSTDYRP
jgi:methylmalonyl-CoA mutase N-terminal domain/subunit